MARPMRTPVKWNRGSVSVAPIAQPFKGILEEYGIPESAYSAEGGFGRSGLLDWEPAEFISPDVIWGTDYVSTAPPPSEYGGTKITCKYGKKADGTCKPKPTDDDDDTDTDTDTDTDDDDDDDDDIDPCVGVDCTCSDGSSRSCVNGNCIGTCQEEEEDIDPCFGVDCTCPDGTEGVRRGCDNGRCVGYCRKVEDPTCAESGECGSWPTCYPCDPGQDEDYEDDDLTVLTCADFDMCGSSVASCYECGQGQDDTLGEEDEAGMEPWKPNCSDWGQVGNWPSCFDLVTDWDDSGSGTWT